MLVPPASYDLVVGGDAAAVNTSSRYALIALQGPVARDVLQTLTGVDLSADVLKVPHHGAATSVPQFFQAVHAQVAVVSVGENSYGHPVPSTLAAIEATGAEVWRTDQHGTVTVTFEDGMPVTTGVR